MTLFERAAARGSRVLRQLNQHFLSRPFLLLRSGLSHQRLAYSTEIYPSC